MRLFLNLMFLCTIALVCYAQENLLENSTYKFYQKKDLRIKDTIQFSKTPDPLILPKFSTLWLKCTFSLPNDQESIAYLFFEDQGYVTLYEILENRMQKIGETGITVPYHKRSIREETAFIKIKKKPEAEYLIKVENFNIPHDSLILSIYSSAQYHELKLKQKDTFLFKYGQPIFLAAVVLILLITIAQLLFFRERVYFYYLLYIIFILLRVAMSINLLVIEDIFTSLREVGFISRFSQSFSILSIIVYLQFIREFADTHLKAPRFDKFILFQILFMSLYLGVEVFVVVEKYTVPIHITIHSWFEILETVFSLITILGLIKLYNNQNKFLIIGVIFLFLVAFVGQQLVLHLSSLSRLEQDSILQFLWGIAYLGEMVFFTAALFSRAAIMKKTIELQSLENQRLNQVILSQAREHGPITISTSKGTIILKQDDIIRLEASGNYTLFHVKEHKQVLASLTMAEFEEKLDKERFLRVHKSHIVNLGFVVKYIKGDGGNLKLSDDSEIPVSRSRKPDLLQRLFTE